MNSSSLEFTSEYLQELETQKVVKRYQSSSVKKQEAERIPSELSCLKNLLLDSLPTIAYYFFQNFSLYTSVKYLDSYNNEPWEKDALRQSLIIWMICLKILVCSNIFQRSKVLHFNKSNDPGELAAIFLKNLISSIFWMYIVNQIIQHSENILFEFFSVKPFIATTSHNFLKEIQRCLIYFSIQESIASYLQSINKTYHCLIIQVIGFISFYITEDIMMRQYRLGIPGLCYSFKGYYYTTSILFICYFIFSKNLRLKRQFFTKYRLADLIKYSVRSVLTSVPFIIISVFGLLQISINDRFEPFQSRNFLLSITLWELFSFFFWGLSFTMLQNLRSYIFDSKVYEAKLFYRSIKKFWGLVFLLIILISLFFSDSVLRYLSREEIVISFAKENIIWHISILTFKLINFMLMIAMVGFDKQNILLFVVKFSYIVVGIPVNEYLCFKHGYKTSGVIYSQFIIEIIAFVISYKQVKTDSWEDDFKELKSSIGIKYYKLPT